MKKSCISIALSLLLVVQPTLPIFEGARQKITEQAVKAKQKITGKVVQAKQKIADVKNAILRGKAMLRDNEECLTLGTGKGCDADTRTGLQILADLLSGQVAKIKAAKKKAQEFMKNNWNCMWAEEQEIEKIPGCTVDKVGILLGLFTMFVIMLTYSPIILVAITGGFLGSEGDFRDEVRKIWEKAHRWDRGGVYKLFYTDIPDLIWEHGELSKSFNSIRYQGQTLIGLVLSLPQKKGLSVEDKLKLIEWLRGKGVVPTREEEGRIAILERPISPLYEGE